MSLIYESILSRYESLLPLAEAHPTDCFRVAGRGDVHPALSCDWYNGQAVLHVWDSPGKGISDDEIDAALAALAKLTASTDAIHLRERRKKIGKKQYVREERKGLWHEGHEDGLSFQLNMTDYLDFGLFLDARLLRRKIAALSPGKRVLNLYAYTGSASVHAAAHGARQVTTVDMSNTYLAWAQKNFEANGINPRKHGFVRQETMLWLQEAARHNLTFDLIFVDPPSFSNSKKMDGVFDVQQHHLELLTRCHRVLSPGGSILFCNNLSSFKLDPQVSRILAPQEITHLCLPFDYTGQQPHRAWHLARQAL